MYNSMLNAIIWIESKGKADAEDITGKAFGILQIEKAYLTDAADFAKKTWTHPDSAYDPATAEQIFCAYMKRYATEKRLGHKPTV